MIQDQWSSGLNRHAQPPCKIIDLALYVKLASGLLIECVNSEAFDETVNMKAHLP